NRMQFLNGQIAWAGGAGEYLMMTSNGTTVLPKAFFKIDTTGYDATYTVKLKNYSKNNYQYSWYKNDTLIGTGYDVSYSRVGYPLQDTIKLIVSNGTDNDTVIQYQQFNAPQPGPVVTSFNPVSGNGLASITITGTNFTGATAVSFGGVPAYYFQVLNNTSISAQVGLNGASGNVTVSKPGAPPGSLAGFTFFDLPTVTSYTPIAADAGASVVITGTNFSATPTNNSVYFGAVKTNVLNASANSLTVTAPAGATYAPVTVTVNTLTALSQKSFPISFTGAVLNATTYPARTNITTGVLPRSVAVADLDLDGKPDLIVVNRTSNIMAVYRNTGINAAVEFAAPVLFGAGSLSKPSRVIAADADGDGKLDLIVTETGNNTLTVFRNTSTVGTISLAAKVTFSTSSNFLYDNAESIAADDFDGDGKIDFAVANLHDQKISIEINKSSVGNFSFQRYDISTWDIPYSVGMKDIDGDGKPDIVVGNSGGRIDVYKNQSVRANNTISLASPVSLSGPSAPKYMSIADFDADGKADIAISDYNNAKIFLFRNSTSSGTISFDAHVDLSCGTNPSAIAIGDVDGDGKPDIAVANTGSNLVSVFRNTCSTGNISFDTKIDFASGAGPEGMFVADINGDSQPELITGNTTANTISVLRKSGASDIDLCQSATGTGINSSVNGSVYQWQINTGTGFINISDNSNYVGTNTRSLQISNIDNSWYGYKFRCVTDAVPGASSTIKFTNTWTGAISTAWENPANWSCNMLPQVNADIYINAGTVIVNASTTVGSLNVAATVTFTLKAGVNITTTH
ncbi:MAG: FG-GAP-like repeat-containing protein, partial [Ferruginibacter sp.]